MGLIKLIKNYRTLGKEEFFRRLKAGIETTSQVKQQKSQFWGHPFILLGILAGIYITFRAKTYWLTSILFGSLIIEIITIYGTYQKYLILVKQEDIIKKLYSQQEGSISNDDQFLNSTVTPVTNNSSTSFSLPADIELNQTGGKNE